MRRVSITSPGFTYDDTDPEGFRAGMFRIGDEVGSKETGTTVYELPPGQAVCPYHYEYGEEEWLLVLSGRPTLRTPDGTSELAPDDVVFFPKGPDGAHRIQNDSDETVRVLMWSQVIVPSATAYPDSDKVGIWTGIREENLMAPRSAKVEYYFGET